MDNFRLLLILLLLILTAGCATSVSQQFAGSLARAIVNQDDPQTVRDGAPAYLLLIDGFIADDPNNPDLLLAGAKLYSSYAGIFVDDQQRAQRMSDKASTYARRALCARKAQVCVRENASFDEFVQALDDLGADDLPALYAYASASAGRIQSYSGDWNAIADLPKVEAMLDRVVALDEHYEMGQAHLYLGAIRSLRPPALGGQPEQGRAHFERALALSEQKNLYAKVEFARRYARLVFDRKLHDQLLNEALQADPKASGLTLSNVLAQRQARILLSTSNDYFAE